MIFIFYVVSIKRQSKSFLVVSAHFCVCPLDDVLFYDGLSIRVGDFDQRRENVGLHELPHDGQRVHLVAIENVRSVDAHKYELELFDAQLNGIVAVI